MTRGESKDTQSSGGLKRGAELAPSKDEGLFDKKYTFHEPKKSVWAKSYLKNFMGSALEGQLSMTKEEAE